MDPKFDILVVYWHNSFPPRTSVADHLYCFERYSRHRIHYLNLATCGSVEKEVGNFDFDLIIFHDLLFCGRWSGRQFFEELKRKVAFLQKSNATKIAVPQDEFFHADLLCEFIDEFDVQHVFSVSPPDQWQKIYREVNFQKVKFHFVLTGYLDELTLQRIERIREEVSVRRFDIGYRAGGRNWRQASWLGNHGMLKIQIGDLFSELAPNFQLTCDISTRAEDTFLGDAWYKFLLESRYNIGVEGGASILDWDGSIRRKTLAFVAKNPDSTLAEIEQNCFPGKEGTLALFALSPRHLESCATRTGQILVEGKYNGVLKAGVHYIELKKDFSNCGEVLERVKDEQFREKLVDNCYREIVASGSYSYRTFVKNIVDTALQDFSEKAKPNAAEVFRRSKIRDKSSWDKLERSRRLHWLSNPAHALRRRARGFASSALKKLGWAEL